eukprot:5010247-Pyramimonas_sp.AAC.1
MDLIQEAVAPVPGDAGVYLTTSADTEVKTMSAQGLGTVPRPAQCDGGARHKLFNAFPVVDLKQILRAKGQRVSGLRDDLIMRLVKRGNVRSDRHAKEIGQLRVTATMRGPLIRINRQDLSSPEAAQEWIE